MSEARLFEVSFDPVTGITYLTAMTPASLRWLWQSEVQACARSLFGQFRHCKMRRDPEVHECSLPSGVTCPRDVAATMQAGLRAAFPDEPIHVWSAARRDSYVQRMPNRLRAG